MLNFSQENFNGFKTYRTLNESCLDCCTVYIFKAISHFKVEGTISNIEEFVIRKPGYDIF